MRKKQIETIKNYILWQSAFFAGAFIMILKDWKIWIPAIISLSIYIYIQLNPTQSD